MNAQEAAGKVFGFFRGAVVMQIILLAEKTGLLRCMAKQEPLTVSQIAQLSSLQERYVLEVLSALSAAGVTVYDPKNKTFFLPDSYATCLLDETSPFCKIGFADVLEMTTTGLPRVMDAMKNGGGVPPSVYETDGCGSTRLNSPSFNAFLVQKWIPAVPGLKESLERGIKVADIGCGKGVALTILAKNFPNSQFYGLDPSKKSINFAKALSKGLDNVTFEAKEAQKLSEREFDLITTFDVIHDLAQPTEVLTAIFLALKHNGLFFIMEPKVKDSLEENMNDLGSLFYSISTLYCMTVSLSEGGKGYGTCMGPKITKDLCSRCGFKSFHFVDIEDPIHNFFLVRKAEPEPGPESQTKDILTSKPLKINE